MKKQHLSGLVGMVMVFALVFGAEAQVLINESFETPNVADSTANPAFPGWSWVTSVREQDSPGDGVPGTTGNQVIQFEYTGNIARYDTTHGWAAGETYVLSLNASPQSWNGTLTRYIVLSLLQTNATLLWTSGNVLLPKYDNSYAGNPWGARQTFSFVIRSDDFSAGTPGTNLRLEINSSGNRGMFFDNVFLSVTNLAADSTAPTPNPLTWVSVPAITNNTNCSMKCTFASDDFPYGVQHYFENTNNGANSGWQDGVDGWTWVEYNLPLGSTNSYRCKARDKSPSSNETAWSTIQTVVMPSPDTLPPNPNPMTWSVAPMVVDSLNIYMVATTAVDAEYGVEYYFENVGTGSNSGWQASTTWFQKYQNYGVPLTYRVKARDISPQKNETAWSTNTQVTIPAPTPPGLLVDACFQQPVYSAGQTSPFYVGWTWDNGAAIYVQNGSSGGVPGASTNKVIEINNQGAAPKAEYATGQGWTKDHIYTLTVNSAPNAWSGDQQRYLDTSLFQTTDNKTLWQTNVPVPLYTNSFNGADPWPAELTFSFVINASGFTNGFEGTPVSLRVTQTGARSLYVDNVRLVGFIPPPSGMVFIIK